MGKVAMRWVKGGVGRKKGLGAGYDWVEGLLGGGIMVWNGS